MLVSADTIDKKRKLQANEITFSTMIPLRFKLPPQSGDVTRRQWIERHFWRLIDTLNVQCNLLDEPKDDEMDRPCTGALLLAWSRMRESAIEMLLSYFILFTTSILQHTPR